MGGRERQGYALADMFFSPVELASRISHDMTLGRALTPLQATRWPQRHGVATGPRVWDQPCTQQTLADASEAPQL